MPSHRTHGLTLTARPRSQCQLSSLRGLLGSLGAAVGDTLCFEPAGTLAARVTLIRAAECGGQASRGGQAAEDQLVEDEGELNGDGEEEEAEETAQQQLGGRPPGMAAAPGQRQPAGQGGFKPSNWGGLDPASSGLYTLVLSPHAANVERRVWISGKLARTRGQLCMVNACQRNSCRLSILLCMANACQRNSVVSRSFCAWPMLAGATLSSLDPSVHGQCLPAQLCRLSILLCIIILLQIAMRRLSLGSLPAS